MKRIIPVFIICFSFVIGFSQKIVEVFPRSGGLLSGVSVTITGLNTHFASGTGTIVVFKQGSNTINGNINASGPNFMHFNSVGNIPDVGFYDLYAQNSLDGYLYKQNAIFIESFNNASIKSVTPTSSNAGSNLNVTITGQNTHFASGTGTTAYFIQGSKTILANYNSNLQDTLLNSNVTIPNNAIGYYDLVTQNVVDGYKYFDNAFRVVNLNKPSILSISPDSLFNKSYPNPHQVLITGINTHFNSINQLIYLSPGIPYYYYFIDTIIIIDNTHIKMMIYLPIPCKYLPADYYLINIVNDVDGLMQFPIKIIVDMGGGINNPVNNFQNIKISPNPFTDFIRFQSEEFINSNLNIDVYSCLGIKLKELKISNQQEISLDMTGFSSGIYYVNFRNEEKSKLVKIIKK